MRLRTHLIAKRGEAKNSSSSCKSEILMFGDKGCF